MVTTSSSSSLLPSSTMIKTILLFSPRLPLSEPSFPVPLQSFRLRQRFLLLGPRQSLAGSAKRRNIFIIIIRGCPRAAPPPLTLRSPSVRASGSVSCALSRSFCAGHVSSPPRRTAAGTRPPTWGRPHRCRHRHYSDCRRSHSRPTQHRRPSPAGAAAAAVTVVVAVGAAVAAAVVARRRGQWHWVAASLRPGP